MLEPKRMSQQETPLTVDEVAAELRVNPETVRTWIRAGELDAIDLGREYRIYRADINDFLQRRRTGKNRRKEQ
jgi:excisionase family DNA binding protein